MSFVQPEFLALLGIVFSLYWLLPGRRYQNGLLLLASVVFYGWVHWWFVGLLCFSAILDYSVALGMRRWPEWKLRLLLVSIAGNLGALGIFKYYDFFVGNVVVAMNSLGVHANFTTLDLILPIGISFYTFQTLSYTIDVYRGRIEPRTDFLDYAVYVSFFAQLVAGPIERADRFLPQVEARREWVTERIGSGFGLALWGAFKKICIADVVAPYVDKVHLLEHPSTVLVFAAAVGFGVQIMADFSGYTDIARGVARMLGFELTINFHRPFLATSTPDFWRRWHISLGSWIGDYVYAPLARSGRASGIRLVATILVTFLLIGLWHGAAWTFVALGVYFGIAMVFYTFVPPLLPDRLRNFPGARWVAITIHMFGVMIPGGLLFREVSIGRVWQHLSQNPLAYTPDELSVALVVLSVAVAASLPMVIAVPIEDHVLERLKRSAWYFPLQTTTWSLWAAMIFIFYRETSYDFIYFQF